MARSPQKPRQPRKPRARPTSNVVAQAPLWERVSPWSRHAIVIGVLTIAGLGFFWQVTFGPHALIGGDIVQWRGMAQAMFEYEEESGNHALWAPNGFSGMPGYHIHYPREVFQVDAIPRFFRNLGFWPAAHFLVLLFGAYALVFYVTRDALAGALGAIAYGFTTYVPIILTAGHNTKFVAMAFAPWLILAFLFALRRPAGAGAGRSALAALLFAVALAVNLRADHVQITYYVAFALGIVWLVEGVGAVRDGSWKNFAIATASVAVGGVLGVLMVAHPYMAIAEYREYTIRAAVDGGLDWQYATRWSQGIGELITLLVPHAYGGSGATYWGPKPFTAGPHYVGPIVLLLAGLAVAGVRRRVVIGLAIATVVMMLLSLGEHFPLLYRPMFEFFPLFSSFRVPETWLAGAVLILAMLAGLGLFLLGRRESTQPAIDRKTRHAHVAIAIIGGILLVSLLGRSLFFSFEAPGEFAELTAAASQQFDLPPDHPQLVAAVERHLDPIRDERRSMFTRDALRALIFLALGASLIILQRRRRIPAWALQVGLVLLVLVDLWQVDRRYFDTGHPALRTSSEVQRLIPEYGVDRYIRAQVDVAGGPGHFRTFPLALNPFNDGRTPYFYESIGGYHGAKLALYQDYIDHLVYRPDGTLSETGLNLMGTRYVISSRSLPGMDVVFRDNDTGLLVLERGEAMPRAWFVENFEVLADDETVLERLQREEVDLRTTALLTEAPSGLDAVAGAGEAEVDLVRHTPREIIWSVRTDRPRLLVTSEVYYPAGWHALVGREESQIYRANHLLRAVVVPEGSHLLSMRFDPPVHRRSVMITMIATVLVYFALVLLIGLVWYRRGESS